MTDISDLELCKKFAELEGINVFEDCGDLWIYPEATVFSNNHCTTTKYNPITDLALNCAARDKYEAIVRYDLQFVVMNKERVHVEWFFDKDIPKAVIECILKSKGLL